MKRSPSISSSRRYRYRAGHQAGRHHDLQRDGAARDRYPHRNSRQEVAIKYRIDGALHYAMPPIAKDWHSTIISRIKVMSELDIAERRVPQDGRFRVRYKGRKIDFRVSIMPTIHGEDAVIRVLDKEQINEEFKNLTWTCGLCGGGSDASFAGISQSLTAWCWSLDRLDRVRRPRCTPR